MNETARLTLQDLIELLADKQNITKKDSETFLREFIALISETIESKDFIRIKDFGTFKLTPVSARRSVDVNTGDPIEIRAHYKLSFTPDKVLREGVNKPFAHFESILIDDDVVFEDKTEKAPPKKAEQPKPVPAPKAVEPQVEAVVEKEEKVVESEPEVIIPAQIVEEEVIEVAALPETEERIDTNDFVAREEIEEKVVAKPKPAKPSKLVEEEAETKPARDFQAEYEDFIDYDYLAKEKKKRNTWIGVGVAVLVLLGGCIYMYSEYFKGPDPMPYAQDNPSLVVDDTTPTLSTPIAEDIPAVEDVNNQPATTITPELTTPEPPVVEATPAPVALEQGAREIEVRPGQTMRALGAEYYGHGVFWVYIFEENRDKIKRPDDVYAGMTLTIAPASKYGIDPKDDDAKRKAQKQEMKLFGEFSVK